AKLKRLLEHATRARALAATERAAILATGERLAVHVFAAALRARGLDASSVDAAGVLVATGDPLEAEPDLAGTRERAGRALALRAAVRVVPGFLAGAGAGGVVLLGRGGSALSATLLAAALAAERVEIWTDTPGVLTAAPRLERTASVHRSLGAAHAARLAR